MKNGRTVLLVMCVVYAVYSIGSGLWGLSQSQGTGGKILILCAFVALLALAAFLIYQLYRRGRD